MSYYFKKEYVVFQNKGCLPTMYVSDTLVNVGIIFYSTS